jgi:phosphopantetheinyl transferase (holo-ACP synthase)
MLVRMAGDTRARVVRNAIGRPTLYGFPRAPHVSISHHQHFIATAMSTLGPVGIDVETIRDLPVEAMAARWFAPEEARALAELPPSERALAFLRLWTLKEAVGKALGIGLRGGGMRRPVGPLPPHPMAALPALGSSVGRGRDCGGRDHDGFVVDRLPHVPGVAAVTARLGDLIVAVACQAPDAAGTPVAIHDEALPIDPPRVDAT